MSKFNWEKANINSSIAKGKLLQEKKKSKSKKKLLATKIFEIGKGIKVRAKSEKQAWFLFFKGKRSDNSCVLGIINKEG